MKRLPRSQKPLARDDRSNRELYKLSVSRILWNDYPAFNAILFPVVVWVITGFLAALDYRGVWRQGGPGELSGSTQALFYIAVLLSLVCIPLVFLRLKIFWTIWKDGIEIPGKITQTLFQRDRGQIFFTYRHKEYEYKARIVVHKTRLTQTLEKDQKIPLVILPKDPKQVFIRNLYLEDRNDK